MEEFNSTDNTLDHQKEELHGGVLMDFSSTFKAGTRGFKKKTSKLAKKKDDNEESKDEVNKDLEDANFLIQPDSSKVEIQIPRELTIT